MSTAKAIGALLAAAVCACSLLWWMFSGIMGGGE
jgi:hypothetical protein